jgi:ABC-type multidrug transport system fused ATPase/permease subunit
MDTIQNSFRKGFNSPPIMALVGLVIGIILGLVYGWVISPVEFIDGDIPQLRDDLKTDYLRMAIDSYALNQDAMLAEERYNRLGEDAITYLGEIEFNPGKQLVSDIDSFHDVVEMTSATAPDVEGFIEEVEPAEKESSSNILKWALLVTIVLAAALVARYFIGKRLSGDAQPKSAVNMAEDITAKLDSADYNGKGESPPMHQFVTTYVLGDNLFDDSFSIESAAGEFLGECGVGISEAIGVGEPKRVTAFEVWLFDQNDIKTVTKVLMSGHAYYDEAIRAELEKKGEPVLADPGVEFVLATNNLRIIGRVMDMGYGEGPLPEESFFERLSIELSVWPNAGPSEPAPFDFDEF